MDAKKMKVYKFGGTSVGTAKRMAEVARIIGSDPAPKIVVLSAMAGTTNTLVEMCDLCYAEKAPKAREIAAGLRRKYLEVIEELYRKGDTKQQARDFVQGKFDALEGYLTDYFVIQDEKSVLSFGELLSTELFHMYLRENGVGSVLIPALSFMRTDRLGEPDMYYIAQNLQAKLEANPDTELFITQGYICLNAWGEVDNLRRGGSDYTATIIGAAIKASEVQIWTDIDGLHDNDPRVVENTAPVEMLSYTEAEELAYFGAKILHPLCVIPAHNAGVPVWLKNTLDPKAHGTLICSDYGKGGVKAIAAKDGIIAIKIQSGRMMMAYGFLRRIFEIFERYRTPIDMITTSEVAVSLTIDDDNYLSRIVSELREFGIVSVDKDQTFFDLGILPQDSDVRHPVAHVLRNIGIAQVQHFQREVRRLGHQLVRTVVDRDTALFEQVQGVFVQTSRLLDSDLQISHFAFVYKISPVFPRAADYEKTRHGNRRVVGYLSYSDTA